MMRQLAKLSVCLLTCAACAANDPPSVAPGINDRYATEEGREQSIQIFEGEGRETYQKPQELIQNLALKPGDVVCEIGAGSGYFTPFLSKAVGNSGKVYAEDPQREFLEVLKRKKDMQTLENVEIVHGSYTDTHVPDGVCDVTFVLDAYHHFEWPKPMLDAMRSDTKSTGRLVIVDWYRRPNPVFAQFGIDALKHVRLDLDAVIKEVESHGWEHIDTRKFLEHQYFAVFKPVR